MDVPAEHRDFARAVAASKLQDPTPTLENLSSATGVPTPDLIHHAVVRWASAGSEALLALGPGVLDELIAAREREDWRAVAGIIDWLASGR